MIKVTDEFGITQEELETIQNEANRLQSKGFKVPSSIIVKFIPGANGLAGKDNIYIYPPRDLDLLRFVVAHEIGHHNEPEVEFDLWNSKTFEQERQESEDFANWFAENM